jgi:pilus assembly protein CpaF
MERLLASSSLTEQAARYLRSAVARKMNLVVSGGTGSGKTSLLGALSGLIDDRERIIVIEDTREVQLQKSHVVYLETRSADKFGRGRITMRDLLRATLRLRPDRIVVGEVRGGEALDLLQAMNSGHGGSMTTAHANSALDTLRRIETMAMMDDTGMPLAALRAQVISAIQLIVCVERIASGERRVSEISLVDTNQGSSEFAVSKVFYRRPTGELVWNEKIRNGEEID